MRTNVQIYFWNLFFNAGDVNYSIEDAELTGAAFATVPCPGTGGFRLSDREDAFKRSQSGLNRSGYIGYVREHFGALVELLVKSESYPERNEKQRKRTAERGTRSGETGNPTLLRQSFVGLSRGTALIPERARQREARTSLFRVGSQNPLAGDS